MVSQESWRPPQCPLSFIKDIPRDCVGIYIRIVCVCKWGRWDFGHHFYFFRLSGPSCQNLWTLGLSVLLFAVYVMPIARPICNQRSAVAFELNNNDHKY